MGIWEPPREHFRLKSVGAADWPMDDDWFDQHPNETEVIHFSSKAEPTSIRASHQLVYYAAGHQKIFGIVEIVMKPELDAEREADAALGRWSWAAPVRPSVIIRSFDRSPSLDVLAEIEGDVEHWRKFVRQMDYKTISDEVFEHAARVLVETADPDQGDILDPSFAAEHGRREIPTSEASGEPSVGE
jgi:hypothetical protein